MNTKQMNVGFSSKQLKTHKKLIKEEAKYLGQFKNSIRPGDVQEMECPVYEDKYFYPEQHGTFQMTPQERLDNCKTIYGEMVIGVEKTNEELIIDQLILKNVSIKGLK